MEKLVLQYWPRVCPSLFGIRPRLKLKSTRFQLTESLAWKVLQIIENKKLSKLLQSFLRWNDIFVTLPKCIVYDASL